MYPHRIRLRGPWERELIDTGRVRFRRRFGYPGRIDAYERVWLTFAGIGGKAEIRLNSHLLGCIISPTGATPAPPACEFEVTPLLRPRNELVVEIEGAAEQSSWEGDVALEVRCTAFLRDLRTFAIQKGEKVDWHVSGQVVGTAERPLELYLLLDRSVAGYQVVTATAEEQPFEFLVPDLPAVNRLIQVDLVNGAVVWYTSVSEGTLETLCDEEK